MAGLWEVGDRRGGGGEYVYVLIMIQVSGRKTLSHVLCCWMSIRTILWMEETWRARSGVQKSITITTPQVSSVSWLPSCTHSTDQHPQHRPTPTALTNTHGADQHPQCWPMTLTALTGTCGTDLLTPILTYWHPQHSLTDTHSIDGLTPSRTGTHSTDQHPQHWLTSTALTPIVLTNTHCIHWHP